MTIKLHHSVTGPAEEAAFAEAPAVVLLHGLFGMGSNLGALARELREDFRVFSVDLPNHGKSDWLEAADIPTMAQCVGRWMAQQSLQQAHFVGHSLGGKVAMELALQDGSRVAALCVADIAPVHYPPHHDDVFAALQAVADAQCGSRAEAAAIMALSLEEDMLIQFLLMSLRRDADGVYQWRFNLPAIIENYEAIRAGLEAEEPFSPPVLFIKGEQSDYILPNHRDPIMVLFPHATLKVMPGCGHWLHAEQPRLFNSVVRRFLTSVE